MVADPSGKEKAKRARDIWLEGQEEEVTKARMVTLRKRLMELRDQRAILEKEIGAVELLMQRVSYGKDPEITSEESGEEED